MPEFSVVFRPADDWIDRDTWQLVCSCGIWSGVSHPTEAEAWREPRHTRHYRPQKEG